MRFFSVATSITFQGTVATCRFDPSRGEACISDCNMFIQYTPCIGSHTRADLCRCRHSQHQNRVPLDEPPASDRNSHRMGAPPARRARVFALLGKGNALCHFFSFCFLCGKLEDRVDAMPLLPAEAGGTDCGYTPPTGACARRGPNRLSWKWPFAQ